MHIAKIKKNGEIAVLALPQGLLNPAEGYNADEDMYIKYIDFDIGNRIDFMNNYYYSIDGDIFVERAPRPNPAAKWAGENWEWLHEEFLDLVREDRNLRLYKSDWTQISDAPITEAQKTEALQYRQALRDITSQCDGLENLEDVPWPLKPDFL